MLSSVIGSGLGFFFWLAVARFYTTTDVGYAVALIQTLGFLAALAHLGLGTAIIRFLPETEAKAALINTSATIAGLGALVLSAVFLAGVSVFVPNLSFIQGHAVYPAVILVTTLALALPTIYDSASYAMRRADVLTWRTIVFAAAKIPLAVGFAFVFLTRGRLGVFLAFALAYVASVLIEALVLLPRILPGFRPRPQLALGHIRPMFRFSLGIYAAGSIGAAGGLLLPILILNVVGPTGAGSVAYFYIASVVAGLLGIIPSGVFTSFYAEASQKNANRPADERKAILLSLALLLPGIGVLWFFAHEMLTWFGNPAYAAGAVGALRILIFGSIPAFLNTLLATRIQIRKRTAPLIAASAIATVITLVLGVLLLQTNGIDGLAEAAVLGSAAVTPYYYVVARKSFKEEAAPPIEPSVLP
jgi:O-antigen/teichoic acid export membrane protein